jgi:hypothetical protein
LMHEGDAQNPDVARIWQTKLPGKLQIFGWLLLHGRLNTRANLHYKNIRQRDEANCEYCHNILEPTSTSSITAAGPGWCGRP